MERERQEWSGIKGAANQVFPERVSNFFKAMDSGEQACTPMSKCRLVSNSSRIGARGMNGAS